MPKLTSNNYLELEEYFNADILYYILNNREKFNFKKSSKESKTRIKYLQNTFGDNYDIFKMCEKYLNNSKDNIIKTKYKQNKQKGRYFAINGLSLQGMMKEIRNLIAKDYYQDIDIVNCHPVILSHICKQNNIDTPKLNKYINHRDDVLTKISNDYFDKKMSKQLILSMLNGGVSCYNDLQNYCKKCDEPFPSFVEKLKVELNKIYSFFTTNKKFIKDYKLHCKKREQQNITINHEGSFINHMLCDYENKILMCIYNFLDSPKNCVLCFDGIMVDKNIKINLGDIEQTIYDTLNIKIKLAIKEMDSDFVIPSDIPKYIYKKDENINYFDYSDNYDYQSFYNEFNNKVYDSYDTLDDEIKNKYIKVIGKVIDNEGSYIKKLNDGYYSIVKKLGISDFTMYFYCDETNKKIKLTLSQYLNTQYGFNKYEIKLNNSNNKNFNIWSGFQAKITDKKTEGFELIKNFIFETWASSNQEYYNYIISWFAGLVKPNGINGVALAMVSEQGTGKGFLLQFMTYILRKCNIIETIGINSITQKHNNVIENKRLVVVNEMSSTKEEFKSNFDKIKSYISDPTISIEPKGLSPYSIDNIGNYILCTNHRDSIIVEKTDRRYAIFEVSNKYRGNIEYFNNLAKKCFNQGTADEFYTYLLNFDCVNIKNIITTELKKELISISQPTPLKFIDAITEQPLKDYNKTIPAADLYAEYRGWCLCNGEKNIYTSTKFGICMKGVLEKKKTNKGAVYILPPDVD